MPAPSAGQTSVLHSALGLPPSQEPPATASPNSAFLKLQEQLQPFWAAWGSRRLSCLLLVSASPPLVVSTVSREEFCHLCVKVDTLTGVYLKSGVAVPHLARSQGVNPHTCLLLWGQRLITASCCVSFQGCWLPPSVSPRDEQVQGAVTAALIPPPREGNIPGLFPQPSGMVFS